MTLVETMVSIGIFAFAATGVVASLVQVQKLSQSNLSQSYAYAVAQGVMEEVIRVSPLRLTDPEETSVTIKLAALTTTNTTALQDYTVPWSTSPTAFTAIGTTSQGILTDAAYLADSNTIRTQRFMPMRVNLQREIEPASNRVKIILRYEWAVPDRTGANGAPIHLAGELRTVRSTALRF